MIFALCKDLRRAWIDCDGHVALWLSAESHEVVAECLAGLPPRAGQAHLAGIVIGAVLAEEGAAQANHQVPPLVRLVACDGERVAP